jgi:hypothetical protein
MSKQDYSRDKSGSYGIIKVSDEKYAIVEVFERDADGNVVRKKQNVLSIQSSIEGLQKLIDKWSTGEDLKLINAYKAWEAENQYHQMGGLDKLWRH